MPGSGSSAFRSGRSSFPSRALGAVVSRPLWTTSFLIVVNDWILNGRRCLTATFFVLSGLGRTGRFDFIGQNSVDRVPSRFSLVISFVLSLVAFSLELFRRVLARRDAPALSFFGGVGGYTLRPRIGTASQRAPFFIDLFVRIF